MNDYNPEKTLLNNFNERGFEIPSRLEAVRKVKMVQSVMALGQLEVDEVQCDRQYIAFQDKEPIDMLEEFGREPNNVVRIYFRGEYCRTIIII